VRKRSFMCVIAVTLLAALCQVATSAARAPSFDLTCAVGGQTQVTWRHGKFDQATFTWVAPAGSDVLYPTVVFPLSPTPPHGLIVAETAASIGGVSPVSAIVSFENADGSGLVDVQADCT
jgi:hypothetical protein